MSANGRRRDSPAERVAFLAPKIFLNHIKGSVPALVSASPAAPHQHFGQSTTKALHPQTQDCDYGAQANCFIVWIIELGMCVDMTWYCIHECWFVPYCDSYDSSYRENFDSCIADK
jgi:hypothetical protein